MKGQTEVIRLVKEGDARVAKADQHLENSDQMTISAGAVYSEAKDKARAIGWSWPSALQEAGSPVGVNRADKLIAIYRDPDPASAATKAREAHVAQMRAARKKVAEEKKREEAKAKAAAYERMKTELCSVPRGTEHNSDTDCYEDEFVGREVSTVVTVPPPDPLVGIKTQILALTTAKFIELFHWMNTEVRRLGL